MATSIFGNGAAGTDIAGGTDIMDQVAKYIASLGSYRSGIYGLTGTVDPRAYGESYDPATGIPTLAAKDSARSDAEFNAQQRQYDADLKLRTAAQMASMSGPKDQIAYQYLLAGLDAPTPSGQAQPYQTTNVPYAPPATPAPIAGAAPKAVTPAPTPTMSYTPPEGSTNPSAAGMAGYLAANPGAYTPEQQANATKGAASAPATSAPGYVPDLTLENMNDPRWRGMAGGGLLDGGEAIVGDDPAGIRGTEEKLTALPPKDGKSRVKVEPLSADKDPIEVMLKMPARAIKMALGGIFGGDAGPSTNTYDAAAIGGQPVVSALKGGESPAAKGFGTELSNPDLGLLDLPSTPNAGILNKLLPSQQDAASSIYNQGLRVDYRDIVARAINASPRGKSGSSLAAYGL